MRISAARVRRIQGVQVVSLANITPLGGSRWNQTFAVQGKNFKPGEHNYVDINAVSARYFETMGIPLLAGRDFRDQAFVRRFFQKEKFDLQNAYEIVGVAKTYVITTCATRRR